MAAIGFVLAFVTIVVGIIYNNKAYECGRKDGRLEGFFEGCTRKEREHYELMKSEEGQLLQLRRQVETLELKQKLAELEGR